MITLKSWGFKYGRPEANFVFDVSYLPNPWRDKEIRDCKSSRKRRELIWKFVQEETRFKDITFSIYYAMHGYLKAYPNENFVVSVCCSAGEYRSPVIVYLLAAAFKEMDGVDCKVEQSKYSKL